MMRELSNMVWIRLVPWCLKVSGQEAEASDRKWHLLLGKVEVGGG